MFVVMILVGLALVVIAANVALPTALATQLLSAVGWFLLIAGALLLLLSLLGVAVPLGRVG